MVSSDLEVLIKYRDRELKDKTDIITKLQERVLQQSKARFHSHTAWFAGEHRTGPQVG